MFKLLGVAVLGYVGYSLYAGRTSAPAGAWGRYLHRRQQLVRYWSALAGYTLLAAALLTVC